MIIEKKIRRKIIVLFLIVLTFLLIAGLIIAEKNTRQICFRENIECFSLNVNPQGSSYLKINVLGMSKDFDVSKQCDQIYAVSKKMANFVSMIIS